MLVYLADLGHNVVTKTSDVYPLGVANLAAYAGSRVKSPGEVEFRIFREPQDLRTALDARPPDVLGLSSYSWNHHLALRFARYAKQRSRAVLTLMGGPNFPLVRPEQEEWLRTMPEIDVAVRGSTYESERAFLNVIQRFADVGSSIEGLLEAPVPGSMWVDAHGELVEGAEVPRIRDLDEIPSPYLAGFMDAFFDTGYFAMMQIARGCPFSCQFCNSAVPENSKISRHSLENIKADLDYIVERIDRSSPLCFADDNFGMYREDEEVADYLGFLMEKYDWPKYIRTTTGKNNGNRIIRVMRKARGRLPMTSAVQSLNPTVLSNIQRSNIRLETYTQIQNEIESMGMQAYGELILCLPGETKASFMESVDELIETGVKRISAHQLMLLHGAPLSNPESRERFGFRTRHRVVARCLGDYTGEPVIETEEMVVETPDFSFDDYIETRVFHLLLSIYYYEGNFEEVFRLVRENGLRPFEVMRRLMAMLNEAPPAFRQMIDDYVRENKEELFESRSECVEWAARHYEELRDGTLGGNLLSKYSMIGRFYVLHEALEFLRNGIASLLGEEAVQSQDMLDDIMNYYRSVMLHVPFDRTLNACPTWTASYDVEAWRDDHYERPLSQYRLDPSRVYETAVKPEVRAVIESRIRTFGEHPAGLGRFTRTVFAQDLRRLVRTRDVRSA